MKETPARALGKGAGATRAGWPSGGTGAGYSKSCNCSSLSRTERLENLWPQSYAIQGFKKVRQISEHSDREQYYYISWALSAAFLLCDFYPQQVC